MDRLRFGTFLAPNIMPVYEAVTEEVGRRLGVETELFIETDYEACAKDENEVCFVCSLPYVEFERQGIAPAVPIAAPVLIGDRYGGRPIYFSDVIVHRDSPFQSFLDLRGHSWAYNEPLSHSGYGITRYHLRRARRDQRVLQRGDRGRLSRDVDAAGGSSGGRCLRHRLPGAGGRHARRPITGPLAAHRRRPRSLHHPAGRRVEAGPARAAREIQEVLTTMHEDPAMRERLALGMVERFVPVEASPPTTTSA